MKRLKLTNHLERNGCYLVREGKRHSVYFNPQNDRITAVPRHNEISDMLAEKICKDLGLPKMRSGK